MHPRVIWRGQLPDCHWWLVANWSIFFNQANQISVTYLWNPKIFSSRPILMAWSHFLPWSRNTRKIQRMPDAEWSAKRNSFMNEIGRTSKCFLFPLLEADRLHGHRWKSNRDPHQSESSILVSLHQHFPGVSRTDLTWSFMQQWDYILSQQTLPRER